MRAKSALAVVCVLVGTAMSAHAADAATRDNRQGQKQARASAEAPQRPQAAPPRQAGKPVQAQQHRAQPRPQQHTNASAQRALMPVRPAIQPQQQAQAALATPAFARNLGAGTPILPVSITSGVSCVPFARMATGIAISGNARDWWHNAAGSYARGQMPERGAILSFPASGGMGSGHVAVVSRLVNARTIEIDHANWAGPGVRRGTVMRGVTVVDVSDRNDWTAVRVQVGHDDSVFGRTYPTHGFIYNRPVGSFRTRMADAGGPLEVAEAHSPHAALHMQFATEALAR